MVRSLDAQALARHSSSHQTQKYIEVSPDAMRKVGWRLFKRLLVYGTSRRSSFKLYQKPHFILSDIKINNSNIIQTPTLIINHFNIAHPSSFNLTLIIRRTAITRWARNITAAGSSLQDVQQLARHSSLQMTQKYIEVSEGAMKRVVGWWR